MHAALDINNIYDIRYIRYLFINNSRNIISNCIVGYNL